MLGAKEGVTPPVWLDKPRKLSQKDRDAKWTRKNHQDFFGYKNHVKTDNGSKLIKSCRVTVASVHYYQELDELLEEQDRGETLLGDNTYTGA